MTAVMPESGPLDAALDAALEAGFFVVPGLNQWLGKTDYQQSLDSGLLESFEDYCHRISRTEARDA